MFIEFKLRAKQAMMEKKPSVFIAAAIYILLPFIFNNVFSLSVNMGSMGAGFIGSSSMLQYIQSISTTQALYLSIVSLVLGFMYALLDYGYSFYCLKAWRGHQTSYNDLFDGFYHPVRIVWANILISLRTFLWGLLFVIPGIIEGISYVQTYKILADDPNISATEAMALSKRMMYGHRMEWFMLQMSFIGWMILAGLTWGITGIYSVPYMEITNSGFYDRISEAFSSSGRIDSQNPFGGFGGTDRF